MAGGKFWAIFSMLAMTRVFAQTPPPEPTTPELPCQDAPGTESVGVKMDSGFVSLFDGTSFKGWWQNCAGEDTYHDKNKGGAILKVDPVNHAIFTLQRASGRVGGMLTTNQKWGNHEIILELWPDFGNDAGLFHRTTDKGKAYQTVIDYKPSNCIGGSYPQEMESVTSNLFYNCSYFFAGSETTPIKNGTGDAKIDRSTFTWDQMWDPNGWNELRVKMFGKPGAPPHHQAWMRKLGAAQWTQVLDVVWPSVYLKAVGDSGYIAFQIHYGTYWGTKPNWYRNIRIRELDADGNPAPAAAVRRAAAQAPFGMSAAASTLTGWLDKDYEITVTDITGKTGETFQGRAGRLDHALERGLAHGVILVRMRAGTEIRSLRLAPL